MLTWLLRIVGPADVKPPAHNVGLSAEPRENLAMLVPAELARCHFVTALLLVRRPGFLKLFELSL
jgi:hypothetical protein